MPIPKRATGVFIATLIGLGVVASAVLVLGQVQADTIVPGFATAHVHLSITVCDASALPTQVKFMPEIGKRYYFKDRAFELAPGLNTVEWYIRKIPGGKYKVTLAPSQGIVTPDAQDVTLLSDKVSGNVNLSVYICEPTPSPTSTATPEQTIVSPSVTATNTVSVPDSSGGDLNGGGDILPPPVPSLPSVTSI